MKIVFNHGMGAMLSGSRPPQGRGGDTVMIIHTGGAARKLREENGQPQEDQQRVDPAGPEDGIRIPGTELVLKSSEEAKFRDSEVRGHERAHLMSLGASAASGINLVTQRGPDGQTFAVGGSIKVDASPVPGDPEATLRKAKNIIHAAMAPGDPSTADMRLAAQAYRMAASAGREIQTQDFYA